MSIYRINTGIAVVGGWASDEEHAEVIRQRGADLTLDEKIVIIPEGQFVQSIRDFVAEDPKVRPLAKRAEGD